MRFQLLTQYFPPEVGAAQTRLLALAKQLQRRGHVVDVVTAMPNYPGGRVFDGYRGRWFMREKVEGLSVTRTAIYPASGRSVPRRLLNYFSFTATAVIGCLANPRPDYLIVESPPLFLGITALIVSAARRRPFVLNVSDLWPASAKELGLVTNPLLLRVAETLERHLYRSSFRVSVQTDGIRKRVAEVIGESKTLLLLNGVDTDLFRPVHGGCPELGAREIGFTYAGTHGYVSDLDVVLDAAQLLEARHEIVFLLVGDGPDKPRLMQVANQRGLRNVRFLAARSSAQIPQIMSASRASIVPLPNRPFFRGTRPAKILPSLACEIPVIFAGEGESADLIESHQCGLVVQPGNAHALAAAVSRLADDRELASELGRNGRRLAERDYEWSAIADRWLAALPVRGLKQSTGAAS